MMIFAIQRRLQDKKGRSPAWLASFSAMVFKAMWINYDGAFKGLFGDGERTIGDHALDLRAADAGMAEAEDARLLDDRYRKQWSSVV